MSTMKLDSKALLRTCVFLLLALTPSFSLAQDPYDEIPKLQQRIDSLETQMYASQGRLLDSPPLNARQEQAYTLLSGTSQGLKMINRELQALYQYKFLASFITDKLATQYAMRLMENQRDFIKKIARGQTELIEKALHIARDQETNRLLLEARDLFRSSGELLDRLQVPEPEAR